jgi:hypothetical protein
MSVIANGPVIRPQGAGARLQTVWRRFARAMRRLDRGERYSPVLCVAALVMVGLIVKTMPAIQMLLAHD